ncbi:Imm1 family immunity protein [Nonomuraea purpurea]|uniref:Imm1 family immunity protein n=1 Tax=Nonomuraea purpurea TaxID=1849276 RepID=A0ABV8FZA4_9ACTN
MVLNAFMHGRIRHAKSPPEMTQLITEVIENLPDPDASPDPDPKPVPAWVQKAFENLPEPNWPDGGMTAAFIFTERHLEMDVFPHDFDNYLHIAVNAVTGFGALTWFVTEGSAVPVDPAIAEHVWISDNPHPPAFDPDVFSDPGFPRYHHPRSTLPVPQIRTALEEFCRTGTGQRPECIRWTPGELSGRRLDTPEPEEQIAHCEDPWCDTPYHPV